MKINIKEVTYNYADGSSKTWYIPQYRKWFLWWNIPENKASPNVASWKMGKIVIESNKETAKEKLAYFLNNTII